MGDKTTIRGLCVTCDCAADCGWRLRDPERTVVHCEEYHCGGGGACAGVRTPTVALSSRIEAPKRGRDKGLCMNCDNRGDCTFRIPEWGVWRCEEYR